MIQNLYYTTGIKKRRFFTIGLLKIAVIQTLDFFSMVLSFSRFRFC